MACPPRPVAGRRRTAPSARTTGPLPGRARAAARIGSTSTLSGAISKAFAVHPAQRIADRGPQVRATAHGLGDEDVRPRRGVQPVGRVHQGVEPAAEAAAGDLFHRESLRAGERGVDQADALVVGDQPDPLALVRSADRARRMIAVVLPAPRKPPTMM